MSENPIDLPAGVVLEVAAILNSGENLYEAYELVLPYIADGDDREFWFEQASLINRFANDPETGVDPTDNLASSYIISHSAYGLKLDKLTADLAVTSNAIASRVLNDIVINGGVRALSDMLQDDISAALDEGGQTIGGWGGSFYYWDLPFKGSTVGENIRSSAAELEKFLVASAVATVAVVLQELGEGSTFSQVRLAVESFLDADLPTDLKEELFVRTVDALVYGQVFADVHAFGDWRYKPSSDTFVKFVGGEQFTAQGEELAFLQERLSYRLDAENIPRSDHIDEVINDLDLGFTIGRPQECFPAGTPVALFDGTSKPIEDIAPSDIVRSFDAAGNIVPGRVTQLLNSVTEEWLELSTGTIVTPGHRFLRPDGSFEEIGKILQQDRQIVLEDGTVALVSAKRIVYSSETSHMFEEAGKVVYGNDGGAALAPETVNGWKTYNFTVAVHHTYIADGIRVHNDSILSTLQAGDQLVALSDDLRDAVILRDVDGDGAQDVVLLDGAPDLGGDTAIVGTYRVIYGEAVSIPFVGDFDLADELLALVAGSPALASSPTAILGLLDDIVPGVSFLGLFDDATGSFSGQTLSGISSGIEGTGGADNLAGTGDADEIDGLGGNDTIFGGSGEDVLDGGDGDDSIEGGSQADTVVAGRGDDTVIGGLGRDSVALGEGDDLFVDDAQDDDFGRDTVWGGGGDDTIEGGGGNDIFGGGDGRDFLQGGGGSDGLYGGAGRDTVTGGDGNDTLFGGSDEDSINGGDGNDSIEGGSQGDTVDAGNGDDIVIGGLGRDSVALGEGDDLFVDDAQDDGFGRDTVWGGGGDDTIEGGGGNDTFRGGDGRDLLRGGEGNDLLDGEDGRDVLWGEDGNDTILGGSGWDTIGGGDGNDSVVASSGDDIVYGGDGKDVVKGGNGNDTLFGSDGDDKVIGGRDDDLVIGGRGDDRLTGSTGEDVFYFDTGLSRIGDDVITDFVRGTDLIELRGVTFSELTFVDLGRDMRVDWSGGSVKLEDVSASALDASDFLFT